MRHATVATKLIPVRELDPVLLIPAVFWKATGNISDLTAKLTTSNMFPPQTHVKTSTHRLNKHHKEIPNNVFGLVVPFYSINVSEL